MGRPKKKIDSSTPISEYPSGTGINPFALRKQMEEADLFSAPENTPSTNPDTIDALLESGFDPSSYEHKVFTLASESNASVEEMSTILDLPASTLKEEFGEAMQKGWTACRVRLRRAQLRASLTGDSKMMGHLGKNILKQDQEDEGQKGSVTIVISTGVPRVAQAAVEVTPETPEVKVIE